jgi:hypothetical protein
MNDSVKKFFRQASNARTAAADSDDEQTKRQWLLVAQMWDLLVREEKRSLGIAPEDMASVRTSPPQK